MDKPNNPSGKYSFLDYFEKHPLVRSLVILSAIVGLIVSFPIIISWFKKTEPIKHQNPITEQTQAKIIDTTSPREYFVPIQTKTTKNSKVKRPMKDSKISNDDNAQYAFVDDKLVVQRHPTKLESQKIIKYLPSKYSSIFLTYKIGDYESETYAKELLGLLSDYDASLNPSKGLNSANYDIKVDGRFYLSKFTEEEVYVNIKPQ